MEHRPPNNSNRLLALVAILAAVLTVYLGVLYNIQVNQHDYYLAQSIRTITREETVEASRGLITDRSGRELVSSRSSYNLTFDSSLLTEEDDENQAILRLVNLCLEQGLPCADTLPISLNAPFTYTIDQLDATQRSWFAAFLQEDLKVISEGTPSEEITALLLENRGLSAHNMVQRLREKYKIPDSFTLNEARAVIGVQYELSVRKLVNTTAYTMVEDIDTSFISLLNDGAYLGAKITNSSVREYMTDAAPHILGTVGTIWREEYLELKEQGYGYNDRIGRTGVEAAFESYLKGKDGRRIVSTNADGKITGQYYEKEPQPGNTVELTIDLPLQQAVETALAATVEKMNAEDGNETRGAGATVIEVGTGEVLALASYPDFNLNTYYEDYNQLEQELLTGELHLGNGVCCHSRQNYVSKRSEDRYERGVEDVSGERNPRGAHQIEQCLEVTESGVSYEETRRILPQFVQRLEGLHDGVKHREEHKRTHDQKYDVDTDISCKGAVHCVVGFANSQFCHITYQPFQAIYVPAYWNRSS